MDQGGVQKEFFQVLMNMLLDPSYGMFTYEEETRFAWINGASLESETKFELVGIVVGLALYNGVILGVQFPGLLYKKLLDEEPNLEDIKVAFPVRFFFISLLSSRLYFMTSNSLCVFHYLGPGQGSPTALRLGGWGCQ
jgi:hypothetical protein